MGFNLIYIGIWTYIIMRFILSERFSLEKMWKNRPFFRADMAGLGKYCTDGYGL